jgi:acyl-CoA reductase-like NAD-dependent aldehyde dehydrogenase
MHDPIKRTTAILAFADRLSASVDGLAGDLAEDLQMAAGFARRAHVPEAVELLRAWTPGLDFPYHPALRTGARRPLGAVAVHLPPEAPITAFARVVSAAFIAGVPQILVNAPGPRVAARLSALVDGVLPGVIVAHDDADTFLFRALTDAFTRAVWVGGSRRQLQPFGALIRETRTRVVLESAGNDPAVVGPDADVVRAAQIVADGAFRNGGLDPARIGRVYVHADVHEAFLAALCDAASALGVERWDDDGADVSPMSSGADRDDLLAWMDAAEDAGASLDVGVDFRGFDGQAQPTLYPTVVSGCAPDLDIVTRAKRGPLVPVVAWTDEDELAAQLDAGGEGAALTAIGLGADTLAALRERFAHVFVDAGPFDAAAAAARHDWPSQVWDPGAATGSERFGPAQLCLEFSRPAPPARAAAPLRRHEAPEAAAAAR